MAPLPTKIPLYNGRVFTSTAQWPAPTAAFTIIYDTPIASFDADVTTQGNDQ